MFQYDGLSKHKPIPRRDLKVETNINSDVIKRKMTTEEMEKYFGVKKTVKDRFGRKMTAPVVIKERF